MKKIKKVSKFQTSDGTLFDTAEEAEEHEHDNLVRKAFAKIAEDIINEHVHAKEGRRFEKGVPLTAGGEPIAIGIRARFAVADWNDDGVADLIVDGYELGKRDLTDMLMRRREAIKRALKGEIYNG